MQRLALREVEHLFDFSKPGLHVLGRVTCFPIFFLEGESSLLSFFLLTWVESFASFAFEEFATHLSGS